MNKVVDVFGVFKDVPAEDIEKYLAEQLGALTKHESQEAMKSDVKVYSRVFVYGTLRPSIVTLRVLHHRFGEGIVIKEPPAFIEGYKILRDSYLRYPAAMLKEGSRAEVETLLVTDEAIVTLDTYEGEGNLYNRVPVTTVDGREGYIYVGSERLCKTYLDYED